MQIAGRLNPLLRQLASILPKDHPARSRLSGLWTKLLNSSETDVQVPFHGEKIWVTPQWRSLDGSYETSAVQGFLLSLQSGDTFWDVGSHIGLYSLLAARKIGPTGRICAWEPSPRAFAQLNRHWKLNGIESFSSSFQEIISDGKQRQVEFSIDDGNEASATNQIYHAGFPAPGRTLTLPASSLDEWAEKLGCVPNVLKMDIEGAEVTALEGATKIASGSYGPPPRILLSVHPASIHYYGRTCSELAAWVRNHGYRAVTLSGNDADLSQFGEVWLIPSGKRLN